MTLVAWSLSFLSRGLIVIWKLSCNKWLRGELEMSIPGAWLPLTTPPLSPAEMLSTGSGALKRSHVRLAVFHADGQVKYASHATDAGQSFLTLRPLLCVLTLSSIFSIHTLFMHVLEVSSQDIK